MEEIVLPEFKIKTLVDNYYSLQLGCFFNETFERDNKRFAFSSIIENMIWNHVYLEQLSTKGIDSIEQKDVIEFRNRKRSICIYISENQDYTELTNRGYRVVDNEVWMILNDSISIDDDYHLSFSKVCNSEDLQLFCKIISECFEPEYAESIASEFGKEYFGKEYIHFLGRRGNQAVSTCSIYFDSETCNIHNISVLTELRQNGFGNDTIHFISNYAKSLNCNQIILQSDGGDWKEDFYYKNGYLKFYRRLGFMKKVEIDGKEDSL